MKFNWNREEKWQLANVAVNAKEMYPPLYDKGLLEQNSRIITEIVLTAACRPLLQNVT